MSHLCWLTASLSSLVVVLGVAPGPLSVHAGHIPRACSRLRTQVLLTHDPSALDCPDSRGDTALHVVAGVGAIDILRCELLSIHVS